MRESVLLPAIALVFLALWAAPASGQDSIDPFPDLEILRPNVDFWTRVFGEWNLSHVAIHDLEHPELVYELTPDASGSWGGVSCQAGTCGSSATKNLYR